MRFYKHTHAFYCGVDLHARSMFTHILDHHGNTVFEADLPADPGAFRKAIAPYRAGLVVGCECMFSWYWLADLCEDDEIPFTLGHALYMKAIHGGKAKNDRIDAAKIAGLLRGGMFPMAYVSRGGSWRAVRPRTHGSARAPAGRTPARANAISATQRCCYVRCTANRRPSPRWARATPSTRRSGRDRLQRPGGGLEQQIVQAVPGQPTSVRRVSSKLRRRSERMMLTSSPKAQSLTAEREAVTGEGDRDKILQELIAEQDADKEPSPLEGDPPNRPRKIHSRKRV
jgi:hypothetical protein